ncbi:O-antigen polymerase [Proteiniborus sp. DW1]|uniref:O-antigen ligase family protein n=1 Tax=Proteiniborus sp. DW1 TaxID=1889883 RepID=UPI00092DFA99|nr:O-antigen ligase family protein [Proteiniborus sp. DW1]SCG83909.1 O-antigen polymerase [Proteiniborus sp. DW1]
MKNILTLTENKWFPLVLGVLVALAMIFIGAVNTVGLGIGIIIIALMFKKPFYAILLYVVGLPFLQDIHIMYLGILVIGIYGVNFIKDGTFKYNYSKVNLSILLLGIIITISTLLSINPRGSFRDFAIHFVGLGILFVFLHSSKTKKDLHDLNIVLVLTATVIAAYGIYQFFNGVPMESGWLDVSQNPDIKTRVYATFENPNLLAEYLIMIFPISLGLFLYNRDFIRKMIFAFTSIIILITIGLTYSRGSWLGMAFGIVLFLMLINWKALLGLIPLGIAGLFVLPASILQRIQTIGSLQDSSNLYRFNLWIKSMDIIKDFWLSGIGIGYIPFQQVSHLYITNMAPYHTHNTYLQIAIEMGIPGLLVFIALILISFKTAVGVVLNSGQKYYRLFVAAYIASISGILVHGLAEHIFFNPKIILVFWLIFGILVNYLQLYGEERIRIINKG